MLVEPIALSAAATVAGLVTLHFASRPPAAGPREIHLSRGLAFAAAGCSLALPTFIWIGFLTNHPAPENSFLGRIPFLLVAVYLAVVFFWFIWRLNCYLLLGVPLPENVWDENWGASYGPKLKENLLKPVFDRLDSEDLLGSVIVDVGSGASPVSKIIAPAPGRKFIYVDIAAKNHVLRGELTLRFDAEKIDRIESLSYRKAIVRTARFLNVDSGIEHAKIIVFSDVLNYVDYRKVILGFAKFLKPAGRIVIVNLPIRGIQPLFSPLGLKNNCELYQFLEEHGFRIESRSFPHMPKDATDESGELLVLVACKCDHHAGYK